jgi:uncharacterized membrane protein YfcA
VVAPLVIIVAYTVFRPSGFGSTVISVPILAHFLPVSFLVPLMVLLDLTSATILGTAGREQVAVPELKRIIPFMFAGFVVGTFALVKVPDDYLRPALAVFTIAIGLNSILNPRIRKQDLALVVHSDGIVGGSVATVFGAGGPIYATYLSGRLQDKTEIRSTMSARSSPSPFTRAILSMRSRAAAAHGDPRRRPGARALRLHRPEDRPSHPRGSHAGTDAPGRGRDRGCDRHAAPLQGLSIAP